MNLYSTGGEVVYDNLFAGTSIPVEVKSVRLAPNQGMLLRGTVLSVAADTGLATIVGDEEGTSTADCILTDPVDTGTEEAIITTAYSSGLFNRNALIFGGEATADKHEATLRIKGIYLKDNLS